jgi:hypothetical protein
LFLLLCSFTLFLRASITFLENSIALSLFVPALPGLLREEPFLFSPGFAGV